MSELCDNVGGRAGAARHSRAACLVAATVVLALVAIPALYHAVYGVRGSDVRRWGEWLRTRPAGEALRAINGDFDKRFLVSYVARALTARVPDFVPRAPDAKVLRGTGGFLFIGDDTAVCMAAGFLHPRFPRPAGAAREIIDLNEQLKARGIHLVVVPVPAKASIYPERLYPSYDVGSGPLVNVDQAAWFGRLRGAGVDAIDLVDLFWQHRRDRAGLLYYATDAHWTDYGKRVAAGLIAGHLRAAVAGAPARARPYRTRATTQRVDGNLVMVENVRERMPYAREEVVQLCDDDGRPVVPGDEAPVLVIGDSMGAMWADQGMGFPQRLMEALGGGVDVQSAAISGADTNRARQVLAERPDLLRGKRAVVFCFSVRHLITDDWRAVRLPAPARAAAGLTAEAR